MHCARADLCAVAQDKLVLLHVGQAAPEQLDGGVVLGNHILPLRDLLPQGSNVDLEVLALTLQGQHLQEGKSQEAQQRRCSCNAGVTVMWM